MTLLSTNSKNLFIVRKNFVYVKKRVINIKYRIRRIIIFIKIFCLIVFCCHLNINHMILLINKYRNS